MNLRRSDLALLGLSLALTSAVAGPLQAQQAAPPAQQAATRGVVTGIIKDATTGAPLGLASVQIVGTSFGATSSSDGRYTIANVPASIHTLRVTRVGYSPSIVADLRVAAGAPTTRDILMTVQALTLTGVVTTGLVDPASGTRAPFSVATVGADKLEVSAVNSPIEALAGKVAGLQVRGGTAPGSNVVIQIRNPLSVYGFTQPMIIVDGVIQMQDDPSLGAREIAGNTLDLNGDNIESIEVVRGAAAAALYGQRAANGVINITTKRGSDIGLGTTRLTVNTESGFSRISKQLPQNEHHRYRVNEAGLPIDAAGRLIDWHEADDWQNDPNLFVDNIWGVPTYDNVRALYRTGQTYRNSLSMAQSSLSTNFSLSGYANHESGIFKHAGGASGQGIGVNIDYRSGNKLSAGMGTSFAKSYTAELALNGVTNASSFLNAQATCKCIDITKIDPLTGDYIPFPDDPDGTQANPLYVEKHSDQWNRGIRAQASGNVQFRPTSAISLRGEGGYQRSDRDEQNDWIQLGGLYFNDDGDPSEGRYSIAQSMDETYNGNARLSLLTGFGGWTVRAGVSTGGQMQIRNSIDVEGDSLERNQRDLDFIKEIDVDQSLRESRSIDYSANIALDFNQKYIVDLVYRNDGSSQLPPETRWSANGRASAAWSMSEEPWWPFADFTLFKPRYSIGTAGNNPNFDDRYELYDQQTGTGVVRISKSNLGNDLIQPEEVTEQEFGIDMAFRNRYSMSLTYVRNTVKNVIRPDTIIAYTGFDTQVTNLGDLRGDTYEATVEAQWVQQRNLRWSSTLVLDRSRQKITSFPRQCEVAGNSDASNNLFTLDRKCEGYVFGQMYGRKLVTQVNELSPRHIASGTALSHFQVNDDGYMVAVGPNSSWTDGRWGQAVVIDGLNYSWGLPLTAGTFNTDGSYSGEWNGVIGQGLPDVSFGFGNLITVGKFTAAIQTVGQIGGDIFNQAKMRAMNRSVDALLDQFGKPDHMKKPISYYTNTLAQGALDARYGGITGGRVVAYPWLLESGTFLKLSELRLAYRLDQGVPFLRALGMTGGSVALVTRDLFTLSDYTGYDPQVPGSTQVTSARVDETEEPNYRNITISIRLIF